MIQSPDREQMPVEDVNALLRAYAAGDESAFERLFTILYPELHRIAHRHIRAERPDHTLCTTALVHEAYLRLATWRGDGWDGRGQFLAFCSRAMRNILVDYARRRSAGKRGDGRISLAPGNVTGPGSGPGMIDLLALDEALEELGARDPRLARLVECRFFGGLTAEETARALDIPLRTLERTWTKARAYLHHLLRSDVADP